MEKGISETGMRIPHRQHACTNCERLIQIENMKTLLFALWAKCYGKIDLHPGLKNVSVAHAALSPAQSTF